MVTYPINAPFSSKPAPTETQKLLVMMLKLDSNPELVITETLIDPPCSPPCLAELPTVLLYFFLFHSARGIFT